MTIEIEYEVRCEGRWVEKYLLSAPRGNGQAVLRLFPEYLIISNNLIITHNFLMIIDLIHNIKILIHSAWEGAEERAVTN